MDSFRVLDSSTLCDAGFLTVARKRVAGPDGVEFDRHVVHHPGAVVVVPVDEHDRVLMVRQWRVAVGSALLELPAGKRDVEGEAPTATAVRELEEELGRSPRTLRALCEFYNSPGFTDEYSYLYLATDLVSCERTATSAEEHAMTIEPVALADVDDLISTRAIVDAKSIIGLQLARRFLAGEFAGL